MAFLDKSFKYGLYLCNGYHDLIQKATNFNDVPIASVKWSDYRVHFYYMSKNDAINIMKNSNLNEKMDYYNLLFVVYISELNNLL